MNHTADEIKKTGIKFLVIFAVISALTIGFYNLLGTMIGLRPDVQFTQQPLYYAVNVVKMINRLLVVALVVWFSRYLGQRWWVTTIYAALGLTGFWYVFIPGLIVAAYQRVKRLAVVGERVAGE